jgi:hypothetical protein
MPPRVLIDIFEGLAAPIDERIVANDHESSVLSALRDTLLPKPIAGELRVRHVQRVVEDAV